MQRKYWEALEGAFYLTAVIMLIAYAISGLMTAPGWH